MTKEEIVSKYWVNPLDIGGVHELKKRIPKMMDEWANEQVITLVKDTMDEYAKEKIILLIENISHQPIQCYSEKVRGQEPKFFLGRSYVEDLIKRIKESK